MGFVNLYASGADNWNRTNLQQICSLSYDHPSLSAYGMGDATWTHNTQFWRLPLYQLSYTPMVLQTGIEPVRHLWHRILSPLRLPIPPLKHKYNGDFTFRLFNLMGLLVSDRRSHCPPLATRRLSSVSSMLATLKLPLVYKAGFEPAAPSSLDLCVCRSTTCTYGGLYKAWTCDPRINSPLLCRLS